MTLQRRTPLRRAPLLRKAELRAKSRPKVWRRPEAEKVTPEDREAVFARDQYRCMAPVIAARYGLPPPDPCAGPRTDEHVRLHAATGGRKPAPSLRTSLAACQHHNADGWCQANKRHERQYLTDLYGGPDDPE